MAETETPSPLLSNEVEEATRRRLEKACARAGRRTAHREEHCGPVGRGATRAACMRVAVEMLSDML
ncbi:MAG TPA: hypothetical protein VJS63_02750 [Bradyrhizobium sp.]|nr:hypothetical protein [Bradyrhizobium sp.]